MRYGTYTLRIEQTDDGAFGPDDDAVQRAVQHAEDVVNDALPEGFYCKIDEVPEDGDA